jgi:hypothetical protein
MADPMIRSVSISWIGCNDGPWSFDLCQPMRESELLALTVSRGFLVVLSWEKSEPTVVPLSAVSKFTLEAAGEPDDG